MPAIVSDNYEQIYSFVKWCQDGHNPKSNEMDTTMDLLNRLSSMSTFMIQQHFISLDDIIMEIEIPYKFTDFHDQSFQQMMSLWTVYVPIVYRNRPLDPFEHTWVLSATSVTQIELGHELEAHALNSSTEYPACEFTDSDSDSGFSDSDDDDPDTSNKKTEEEKHRLEEQIRSAAQRKKTTRHLKELILLKEHRDTMQQWAEANKPIQPIETYDNENVGDVHFELN
jgi:hypothetical protein